MFDWLLEKLPGRRRTIGELTAAELARYASTFLLMQDRDTEGARLIYHALVKDAYEPTGLRALSDFLDVKDTMLFSALVLEYALAPESPLKPWPRRDLAGLRFFSIWTWGYSRHVSGAKELSWEAFRDRSAFVVDEQGYYAAVRKATPTGMTWQEGFEAARRYVGYAGGLLRYKPGSDPGWDELFLADRFEDAPAYGDWLARDTKDLEAQEKARAKFEKGSGRS